MEDSDHESTQSGVIVGSNDDLLTEILHRLPVTSILRFKSVSKHWQWLLSHRHLIRMHDHLFKSPGYFCRQNVHSVWQCVYVPYDVDNPTTPPFRSLELFFDRSSIQILQSCNGLLLLCNDIGNNGDCEYYVFNPTTMQLAIVPSIPGEVPNTVCFMGLAFHQTDCVHYKLVCIHNVEPHADLFQFEIYSSDTGKWKICTERSFYADCSRFSKGVYWNGAIHWAPYDHNHYYFTIETEQLQTFPLSMVMMSYYTTMYFGESRGHLHLILVNAYCKTSLHLNVYEMLSDHSGWFVKYQVELDGLATAYPEIIHRSDYDGFKVVDVVRGEKEEDTFMVLMTAWKMVTYNVHDKSFKHTFSSTRGLYGIWVEAHRYIENFSSF